MLNNNSQTINSGHNSVNYQVGGDLYLQNFSSLSIELLDQRINQDTIRLKQSRFHLDFDKIPFATNLGNRVATGAFSVGSQATRATALAWCSRILRYTDSKKKESDTFLELASSIDSPHPEVKIAEAFKTFNDGDLGKSLKILYQINSPSSRTAALMITARHDENDAIPWLNKSGTNFSDLDGDGKFFYLSMLIKAQKWEDAFALMEQVGHQDFTESPITHHVLAVLQMLIAVPDEYRQLLTTQLPLSLKSFKLSDEPHAIQARKDASKNFKAARDFSKGIGCDGSANIEESFSIWLELKDKDTSDQSKDTIRHRLQQPKSALHLIPLALDFGISLNLEAVRSEIDQHITLNGEMTYEAALAVLAIALHRRSYRDTFDDIENNITDLSKYLTEVSLRSIQIEVLANSGAISEAEHYFNLLKEKYPKTPEIAALQSVISISQGASQLEFLKRSYSENESLPNLQLLVDGLEQGGEWKSLSTYALKLYDRTKNLSDAETYVKALSKNNQYENIILFVNKIGDTATSSASIQMGYAWALFQNGDIIRSRDELNKTKLTIDDHNFRNLSTNIAIYTGDWESLSSIVSNEKDRRHQRTPEELLYTANLAIHLSIPHAKELILAAIERANNCANIYLSAYSLWIKAGWDESHEVSSWLHRSAELSGENGPIKKISLKEIVEMKPNWDNNTANISDSLCKVSIPMCLAAQSLNRSLLELIILSALKNKDEPDPRKRFMIPAYSGRQIGRELSSLDKRICLDPTAILTLDYVGLLDSALNAAKEVYIPHSTLPWLFHEMKNIMFHQPRIIKDAQRLRSLISNGRLEAFSSNAEIDDYLLNQVGEELASFIAEARHKSKYPNDHIVIIKPGPVYRAGSLMDEVVDMKSHSALIGSCRNLVEVLKGLGSITAKEEEHAVSYLKMHEIPWTNEPNIPNGATLFLDSLAVDHLAHLGLLGKLHQAGFKAVIAAKEIQDSNNLINHGEFINELKSHVENIRITLKKHIESGKIKYGKSKRPEYDTGNNPHYNIAVEAALLFDQCDATIVDDRFFNQHETIGSNRKPIHTTFEVINYLSTNSSEAKTLLLQSGFSLFPFEKEELLHQLRQCLIKGSALQETAEVKAIRENIQSSQMSGYLQIPSEIKWFARLINVFTSALKEIWSGSSDDYSNATIISNWIFDVIDTRGWANSFSANNDEYFIKTGYASYILPLLVPAIDMPTPAIKAYNHWVEEHIITPIKDESPELYAWLIDQQKALIVSLLTPQEDVSE